MNWTPRFARSLLLKMWSIASPRILLEMQDLRPCPSQPLNLLNQNLLFNQNYRWSVCIVKSFIDTLSIPRISHGYEGNHKTRSIFLAYVTLIFSGPLMPLSNHPFLILSPHPKTHIHTLTHTLNHSSTLNSLCIPKVLISTVTVGNLFNQQDRQNITHPRRYLHSTLFFLFINLFYLFYFWLRWVFVAAHGLSLIAVSRGATLLCGRRLLIAVASLVAEHRL